MEVESRLVPVLREGVQIVKMILFKELRAALAAEHPAEDGPYINRLAGAVVNELFGVRNTREPFAAFAAQNAASIDHRLRSIAAELPRLRGVLTDALRMQFLCDSREGIDSRSILARADDLGILQTGRDVPLPKTFMNLVRRLGVAYRLLQPLTIADEEASPGRH